MRKGEFEPKTQMVYKGLMRSCVHINLENGELLQKYRAKQLTALCFDKDQ